MEIKQQIYNKTRINNILSKRSIPILKSTSLILLFYFHKFIKVPHLGSEHNKNKEHRIVQGRLHHTWNSDWYPSH